MPGLRLPDREIADRGRAIYRNTFVERDRVASQV